MQTGKAVLHMQTSLRGIANRARQDKEARFGNLCGLLSVENLRLCFYKLRKNAATGIDGVTYQEYVDDIKRMSNGRLVVDVVYDGEGVSAMEVLSATKSGLVEMGSPYQALHAGELPAGVVELGLPGGPGSYQDIRALFREGGWIEAVREAYGAHGLYYAGEAYQPGTYVLTKKPINTLDDFKELKIRCPGAYGKMLRNLGASPVVMAFSEVYTALATGVVDGVDGCNLVDHESGKLYEQAPYMYPLSLTSSQVAPIIVNRDAWNQLPDDLKAIVDVATWKFGDDQMVKSVVWEKQALEKMLAKGLKMSPTPSAADVAKWKEAGRKVWPEYEAKDKYCKKLIEIQDEFMKKLGY